MFRNMSSASHRTFGAFTLPIRVLRICALLIGLHARLLNALDRLVDILRVYGWGIVVLRDV
jgi:hypothetical protein